MTQPLANPEFERIRGYLQAQAAEKSIDELIRRAQEGIDDLYVAAREIPAGQWEVDHPGEQWSPRKCMEHIVASDLAVGSQILHVALTGELPAYREEVAVAANCESAITQHQEGMDSLYAHVREADPGAHLDVKWKHPMFGDLNWREWLLFLRIHARDHGGQLKKMLA